MCVCVFSWIRIVGEGIGDFIVFFTAFFVVLNRETMDPGTVGLALSFSLQVKRLTIVDTVATDPNAMYSLSFYSKTF